MWREIGASCAFCPLGIREYGKMGSGPEKAFYVLAFRETKSVATVQRQFPQNYGKIPPRKRSFCAWYEDQSGLCKISHEIIRYIWQKIDCWFDVARASREAQIERYL
jgi:hypothetical protein